MSAQKCKTLIRSTNDHTIITVSCRISAERTGFVGGDEDTHAPRAVSRTTWHFDTDLVLGVGSQFVEPRRCHGDVDVTIATAQRALPVAQRVHAAVTHSHWRTVRPTDYYCRRRQHDCVYTDWWHQRSYWHQSWKHTSNITTDTKTLIQSTVNIIIIIIIIIMLRDAQCLCSVSTRGLHGNEIPIPTRPHAL